MAIDAPAFENRGNTIAEVTIVAPRPHGRQKHRRKNGAGENHLAWSGEQRASSANSICMRCAEIDNSTTLANENQYNTNSKAYAAVTVSKRVVTSRRRLGVTQGN
jgi:hypothetical protein